MGITNHIPFDFTDRVMAVIKACPHHVFLVLTKRPKRMAKYFELYCSNGKSMPKNLYTGVTAENQKRADERIPILLQVPGKHFVSLEPLLGPIDLKLHDYAQSHNAHSVRRSFLHSVILGGETGPKARPIHPDWVRKIRDDCVKAGVPFFFKQWGKWCPDDFSTVLPSGTTPTRCWVHFTTGEMYDWAYPHNTAQMMSVGRKTAGRLLDGKEHNKLPWNIE